MKLTSAQVDRALGQLEAQAIPENHPAVAQLSSLFGEHTFFLDSRGLDIVEPAEPTAMGTETETGMVVKLARWKDQDRTSLVPHEPEPTDVVVQLGPAEGGPDGP